MRTDYSRRVPRAFLVLAGAAVWIAVGHGQNVQPATPAPAGAYNVRAFGATGDGHTLDTAAINRAIDAAAAAGGGTVRFPAGDYLSVSIHLKSHVGLFLDSGATIVAAAPAAGVAYDAPEPNPFDAYQDFGHSHWHNSLIWGEQVEDVFIGGPGRIWGKGLVRSNTVPEGGGNKAIALKLSRNVIIRDVSILSGGHFAVLATGVDNLTIDNVKIDTNRDGIDVDACRNVRLSNLSVNSPSDDGICLKSSFGLGIARATENVTITNSQVSGYDEGTFLDGTYRKRDLKTVKQGPTGRLKFGTESNGGFKNITISNVVFDYCRGLALETVDGGPLEDVTISNITMRDVMNAPIFVRLGNRARGPKEATPIGVIRRVKISHVVAYNADPRYASIVSGIPGHDIEDLTLNDIRLVYRGGGTKAQAALAPPENETAYPEPAMFGEMPAYGFYIRHVKGLDVRDLTVSVADPDARPAFVLDDVKGAEFQHVRAARAAGVPTFLLKNVRDFAVHQSAPLADVRLPSAAARSF